MVSNGIASTRTPSSTSLSKHLGENGIDACRLRDRPDKYV
jgi:hypothetical protein